MSTSGTFLLVVLSLILREEGVVAAVPGPGESWTWQVVEPVEDGGPRLPRRGPRGGTGEWQVKGARGRGGGALPEMMGELKDGEQGGEDCMGDGAPLVMGIEDGCRWRSPGGSCR